MRREVGVTIASVRQQSSCIGGKFRKWACPMPSGGNSLRTCKDELDVTFVMDSSIHDGVDLNFLLFPRGSELPL